MSPFSFDKEKLVYPSEFQAVILAGYGNRLYPLTEEATLPKALLPVANRPLVSYQLAWLEAARVRDIIIVTQAQVAPSIRDWLQKMYEAPPGAKIEVEALKEWSGTADALRQVRPRIRGDVVVLSCDIVCPDLSSYAFVDHYRLHNPSASAVFYNLGAIEAAADRPLDKEDDAAHDLIGVDPDSSRLVMLASEADSVDTLSVSVRLLEKFPKIRFYRTYQDAHIYIFKRWVLDLLVQRKTIGRVREGLLPLLVEAQYKSHDFGALLDGAHDVLADAKPLSTMGHSGDVKTIKVTAVLSDPNSFLCRANTLWRYLEANRVLARPSGIVGGGSGGSAGTSTKSPLPPDVLVGDGTKIAERTRIKRSVIGHHCVIGKNVRMANTVLMDYCVIGDNVRLENCVVCNSGRVMDDAHLRDCRVAVQYVVEAHTEAKNESFVDFSFGP
ncbi:hypothetical protein CXG81DRAFT_15963 [Caulochytrium protostelioides]|uniref:Translation initiation factor eIF2B subunit gamma n=1 Tax=Caulochytrium protostelioides TaxID=1555241 RepID=A0A4V1ITV7_9FUNG|nr:nucleotide-diphospho-sugar transferase [Caulochytrium protostelioides]RKO98397.1 hypothetical protein CXG81DRAFT_15963 [Caulochytrium protostelioides]|eukprot:RKO98397.1 hypothetical protein CXG81DRAFT_15963 [Caulochytrium protostelioides]